MVQRELESRGQGVREQGAAPCRMPLPHRLRNPGVVLERPDEAELPVPMAGRHGFTDEGVEDGFGHPGLERAGKLRRGIDRIPVLAAIVELFPRLVLPSVVAVVVNVHTVIKLAGEPAENGRVAKVVQPTPLLARPPRCPVGEIRVFHRRQCPDRAQWTATCRAIVRASNTCCGTVPGRPLR